MARKHGVFKIETIGDCYVAVVGLPKRQKNHAIVMVKFASAIRSKMIELINELEGTLGPVSTYLLTSNIPFLFYRALIITFVL